MLHVLQEYNWLNATLINALKDFAEKKNHFSGISLPAPPVIRPPGQEVDEYAQFVQRNKLNTEERFLLIMTLSRYIYSDIWKQMYIEGNPFSIYVEQDFACSTPNTFLFILSGNNAETRLRHSQLFSGEQQLFRKNILETETDEKKRDLFASRLNISGTYRELLLWNKNVKPRFSAEFPARELTTSLAWDDLKVDETAERKLLEIEAWLSYHKEIISTTRLGKHTKPGYRCLFYGPSGTGKTLAATLIGKKFNQPVFRVDLSGLISKYVGETSKNLSRVFDMAEDKGWILFFDEGDALFGKRVDNSQSENKNNTYANQEIAFLLQRIETYNGLVIVATNLRKNMDDAFSRRFENIIYFKPPSIEVAEKIWNEYWPEQLMLEEKVDVHNVLKKQSLSVASIFNVINRITLRARQENRKLVSHTELDMCIKDELVK